MKIIDIIMKIIGLHGPRRAGKDTFYKLLKEIDSRFLRFAFADELKEDLTDFISDKFRINIHECTAEEKELIRPLLIAHGCVWREIDILHWVKGVDAGINSAIAQGRDSFVITDVRFPNEAQYFVDKYGESFNLVDIELIGGMEPTEEEKKHIPMMKQMSDFHITWPKVSDVGMLKVYVEDIYEEINQQGEQEIN